MECTRYKVNVKQQPLSVLSPPVSARSMSLTALEPTDTNGNNININESRLEILNYDDNNNLKKSSLFKIKLFFKDYIELFKLVFKSIIPDLKSFKWWQALILIFFATFMVVFSVLDFNSFFPQERKRSILKWINDYNDGVPLWRRILLCFSGVAAFTNVLNVVLVIQGKISSYFWGIIGAILYGVYAFAYGYVGDAQLYVLFFLPMQFVGIYTWSKRLDNESTTRVKSLKLIEWIFVIILCGGFGVLFYYEIPAFSKLLTKQYFFETMLVPHILDASTNAISVVGQVLLTLCYWEQYILWTCVNLIAILMYSGLLETRLEINVLLVWIMLLINSLVGLYTWYRRWKYSDKIETVRF